MRCQSCNKLLNDDELHYRGKYSNQLLDLCTKCLSYTDIEYKRKKRITKEIYEDDPEDGSISS